MPTYYCLLGNTPDLSFAELNALYPRAQVFKRSLQVASLQLTDDEAAHQLMDVAGGTVKVIKELHVLTDSAPDAVQKQIAGALIALNLPKVTFGVAEIGRDHLPPLELYKIKRQMEAENIKVRFVEGSRQGLSASILLHQEEVVEMNVLQLESQLVLGQTVGIQDIDTWSEIDRSKPYANRKKGMLPPKVGRMMINLALTDRPADQAPVIVYDPFCGTGTILLEALRRGCQVVGSDLDPESIEGSQRNLSWFAEQAEGKDTFAPTATIFASDVSQVKPEQLPRLVDYIVTEPFLGRPQPRPEQLTNVFRGIERLYLGAFKQWTKLLADQAKVVIVFPQVNLGKHVYGLQGLIDKLESFGYTITSEPLLYHRPQAVVQRQIYIFKYTKK